MANLMPGKMTVASICEETTAKLRKVAELQANKVTKAQDIIERQEAIAEQADTEVKAANNAITAFEKLFGVKNEEIQS